MAAAVADARFPRPFFEHPAYEEYLCLHHSSPGK